MMEDKFDANVYTNAYVRCFSNQLNLMEKRFLLDEKVENYKEGIASFYKAQIIINSKLDINGYKVMPIFWFRFTESEC